MNEKLEAISRRTLFSVLGLAVAASAVVPAAVITATEAEAVVGDPTSAASVAGMNLSHWVDICESFTAAVASRRGMAPGLHDRRERGQAGGAGAASLAAPEADRQRKAARRRTEAARAGQPGAQGARGADGGSRSCSWAGGWRHEEPGGGHHSSPFGARTARSPYSGNRSVRQPSPRGEGAV